MTSTGLPQAIVVTGASGGIGSAVASLLASRAQEHGAATVIGTDLNPPHDRSYRPADGQAGRPATVLPATGGGSGPGRPAPQTAPQEEGVRWCSLDVTDAVGVEAFFEQVASSYRLRAVVHAAGVLVHGPALDTPAEQAAQVMAVNALGTVNVCTAAARHMTSQDPGDIPAGTRSLVTVASNSALRPRSGLAAYSASKAAASQFTRSLGLELGPAGIRCNVVAPGTTLTPMVRAMWAGQDRRAQTVRGAPEIFQPGIPLGRVGEPADVAHTVAFLVSEGARHITLAELAVDGGTSQR
ncbi:SDR family oxidoreductase [Actinomyces lilanjuaniae]|uniref:SDR family oxidoreductase n=1 Tax=Actinomyces lilanjuaniae TaxID=2321394 RepID=A0ABM6Z502_9ACTO|nr:SDR family oxidoreductase [Actinomyces lilanjuaniae]AYD90396.1 SDR family oxidoreductase [Actinomyces lilanjuaniae]